MNIIYEGFFVIGGNLSSKLEKSIDFQHITTEFRPSKTHQHLYGCKAVFQATMYGNDGNNEGCLVKLLRIEAPNDTYENELRELYDAIPLPHITLSTSLDGKPINTKNIDFDTPIDSLIIITQFGGFIGKPIFNNMED